MKKFYSLLLFFSFFSSLYSQNEKPKEEKKWYDNIQLRGYAQVRYNGLLETNPNLGCEQCDRNWGAINGLSIRRMRLIFSGQISPRVYFYIQPDFASSTSSTSLHFGQLRDMYFDLGLDNANEFRIRIGQSKIPFGFENMQSSQNRLPLDRSDALNSAISNERDLGAFFYWAPKETRKLFSSLVKEGLKGSGDYGVFGLGLFNGQIANRPELNLNRHVVARLTYPFALKNQIIELGIQAYKGLYTFPTSQISSGTKTNEDKTYNDERMAASFVLYPQPFGIQAEYNIGNGPEFDVQTDSISTKRLKGGYATFSYKFDLVNQTFIPFLRFQKYNGGKKHELDARSYNIKETEFGIEWQPAKQFELVVMYTMSERRYEDYVKQDNYQKGNLLRIQAQINF